MVNEVTAGMTAENINRWVKNSSQDDNRGQYAVKLGETLTKAEASYYDILSNLDKVTTDASGKEVKVYSEGDVQKAKMDYQKAMRIFEAFKQFSNNSFQILMQGIRALALR